MKNNAWRRPESDRETVGGWKGRHPHGVRKSDCRAGSLGGTEPGRSNANPGPDEHTVQEEELGICENVALCWGGPAVGS